MFRKPSRSLMVLALVLVGAGCAAQDEEPRASASRGTVAPPGDGITLLGVGPRYPLGLYDFLTPADPLAGRLRQENATVGCLQEAGWDVAPFEAGDLDPLVYLQRAVAEGDRQLMSDWGYGIVTYWAHTDRANEQFGAPIKRPTVEDKLAEGSADQAAFYRDLNGQDDVADDGCVGEGVRAAQGPRAHDQQFFAMQDSLMEDMRGSEAFRELNEKWSTCMQDHSFVYGQPGEAFDEFEAYVDKLGVDAAADELVADREVAVAAADYACRDTVGYSDAIRQQARPFVQQIIERFPDALDEG